MIVTPDLYTSHHCRLNFRSNKSKGKEASLSGKLTKALLFQHKIAKMYERFPKTSQGIY